MPVAQQRAVLAQVHSAATLGVEAYAVEVEVDFAGGLPAYHLVGLPATAVQEGRFRIRAALTNSGFSLRAAKVTINLAPADVRKDGAAFDLPIAVGMLVAAGDVAPEALAGRLFLGELSLDGALRPVRGSLPIAAFAAARGYREILLPQANAAEAALVGGIAVHGASHLGEIVAHLGGQGALPRAVGQRSGGAEPEAAPFCYREVRGHPLAVRALEVAAAGGHNVLLVGPPGSGKTMLAQRVPTILPPMTFSEALESSTVYSVAGLLGKQGLLSARPFRAPHHTVSPAGLLGGGDLVRPGEVSLAHNGVLFLDELPEYTRACLEALRQPLEDKRLTLVRARRSVTYPASFMLVAAMNPCPCGHAGDEARPCRCSPDRVERYRGRLSGPLLDRFDLHIWVGVAPYRALRAAAPGEPSPAIRGRVRAARERQQHRFRSQPGVHVNGQVRSALDHPAFALDGEGDDLLDAYSARTRVSTRALERIVRVARTIADLRGRDEVAAEALVEAIGYRYLDQSVVPEIRGSYGGATALGHPAG